MNKNSSSSIRSFIAVRLEGRVKERLSGVRSALENNEDKVRWVKRESLHITLKFLGNITEKQQKEIEKSLSETCLRNSPFTVHFKGAGVFPQFQRPQVVWIGIKEGGDLLSKVAGSIERALHPIGFKSEKRAFVPHITVARIKSIKNRELFKEKVLSLQETFFAEQNISAISLMKSDLTPTGAIYTQLSEFPFG